MKVTARRQLEPRPAARVAGLAEAPILGGSAATSAAGLLGLQRTAGGGALDRFEKAGKTLDKAKADTGHGIVGSIPALNTAFKTALDADGSRPLTPYVGEKRAAWQAEKDAKKKLDLEAEFIQEAYAEAFSLYTTEPETLRALRPKIFAFFQDKQGKLEKAAAKKP